MGGLGTVATLDLGIICPSRSLLIRLSINVQGNSFAEGVVCRGSQGIMLPGVSSL